MSVGSILFPKQDQPETDPIIGYRCWEFHESSEGVPVLYSSVQDFCWLPFEPAKGDINQDGGGIYAWKSVESAYSYWDANAIAGEVFLWGSVLEHEDGYRAEFAYPKELWVGKEFDPTMILRLEETYGVPVNIKEDFPIAPPPIKFTSGIQPGLLEIVRDVIYDREPVVGQNVHLFCRPMGSMTFPNGRPPILKNFTMTNMVLGGSLAAPMRFLIKAIRCVFLETDGRPVPITDPIWWRSTIKLSISMKSYWNSPVAYVADPAILLGATDWSKIPAADRLNLINSLSRNLSFGTVSVPGTAGQTCSSDGIIIEQQQCFDVRIETEQDWPGRDILCALEGVCGRGVL